MFVNLEFYELAQLLIVEGNLKLTGLLVYYLNICDLGSVTKTINSNFKTPLIIKGWLKIKKIILNSNFIHRKSI